MRSLRLPPGYARGPGGSPVSTPVSGILPEVDISIFDKYGTDRKIYKLWQKRGDWVER